MFKIGEFARIADVSIHLLRHYDDIDLFKPAQIDPHSGYRYYSAEQLPQLHRIVALRELGMTLDQIRKMLHEPISDCEIQGMLRLRQQQVEQLIETEHTRLRRIETRLKRLQQERYHAHDIVLKTGAELVIASTGRLLVTDAMAVTILREAKPILVKRNQLIDNYSISIVYDATTPDQQHHIEIGYPVKDCMMVPVELSTGHCLIARQIPRVEMMATVVHHGARIHTCAIYQDIFQWMSDNNYTHHDEQYPRELYYQAGLSPTKVEDVVEIQVPVKAIGGN